MTNIGTEKLESISSKGLYEFYKAYYQWATGKNVVEHDDYFTGEWGLCGNLEDFAHHALGMNTRDQEALNREMTRQFLMAGVSSAFPFGHDEYCSGEAIGALHMDKNRRQWCLDKIKEYEDAQATA